MSIINLLNFLNKLKNLVLYNYINIVLKKLVILFNIFITDSIYKLLFIDILVL